MSEQRIIDLRSDTLTQPTDAMRRAMAEAEVGDDVFGEDPTVNRLQDRAAGMFGREAAIFVPTGVMGNLIAIACHTQPGNEVICERDSHVMNYETGSMAVVAGVMPRVVVGERGIMSWPAIEHAIRPKAYYLAQTALVCVENTHNLAGGTVYPAELCREICEGAHEAGLPAHLDGARLFNAAVALGATAPELAHGFDSVMITLSKGLGAPVGSLLLGSAEFIERARRKRKMLGGGMRQAGILAAAGLIALEKGPAHLAQDHDLARRLAEGLAEIPGIEIDPEHSPTNVVIFDVEGTGFKGSAFCDRLEARGVRAVEIGLSLVRFVTHRDVQPSDVGCALEAARAVAAGS